MATRPDTRLVRARLLLLVGCLTIGVGAGLLLTGSTFAGIAAVSGALLMSGGAFSMGVHPGGTLVRRLRQAPALGLVLVGGATSVTDIAAETVLCLALGAGLLVADHVLARRAAGSPAGWSVPRPRSVVPAEESRRATVDDARDTRARPPRAADPDQTLTMAVARSGSDDVQVAEDAEAPLQAPTGPILLNDEVPAERSA